MLGHGLFISCEPFKQPGASSLSVGHSLQCREGFRRDDKERFRRVEIMDSFSEVRAVDVRDEPEGHGTVAIILEGLVGHHRPKVGAPDTDVDDVANAFDPAILRSEHG